MPVTFQFHSRITINERRKLKQFISDIFSNYGLEAGNITYILASDEFVLQMNTQYLNHNFYTDILTFDLSDPGKKEIDADIIISVDRVRENAVKFKTSERIELHRVIFHGILHLCGFKDKKRADQKIMKEMESTLLSQYLHVPRSTVSK